MVIGYICIIVYQISNKMQILLFKKVFSYNYKISIICNYNCFLDVIEIESKYFSIYATSPLDKQFFTSYNKKSI